MARFLCVLAVISIAMPAAARGPAAKKYGQWMVDKSLPGIQIASVENDVGGAIGVICFLATETCAAFVITTNACDEGKTFPMMLNAQSGSAAITTVCRHFPGGDKVTMMNVVNEFQALKEALEGGGIVGIAMPMQNGAFHVLRFSTDGATAALESAMSLPPGVRTNDKGLPTSSYQ